MQIRATMFSTPKTTRGYWTYHYALTATEATASLRQTGVLNNGDQAPLLPRPANLIACATCQSDHASAPRRSASFIFNHQTLSVTLINTIAMIHY